MTSVRQSALIRSVVVVAGACAALAAPCVGAQVPTDAARGSLVLDQRNDEFGLQLRQWQQMHEIDRASGGDPVVRREMQTLHLQQRQRQDDLHSRQLLDYDTSVARQAPSSGAGGPQPVPGDLQRFARERAEQSLRQEYELDEQALEVKAKPKEGVPHWGPTLTPRE